MRMEPKAALPAAAFSKVLRSFQTGGVSYNEFLTQVDQQLAAGASPTDMLEILRRRESVEPLPAYAHTALFGLLSNRKTDPVSPSVTKPTAPPELSIVRKAPVASSSEDPAQTAAAELTTPPLDASASEAGTDLPALPPEAATVFLDDGDTSDEGQQAPNEAPPRVVAVGDYFANRFALLELIGVGGMSRVFKATDTARSDDSSTASFVAVKVLTRPFNDQSGSFAEFQKEVQKLHSLSHPNIVRLFECGRDGASVFMTMEYLVGASLYERLHADAKNPAAPREDAHAIVTAIASALEYAHANDVVHGDLKPGNVIITDHGEIKLIDFGIAWWIARPKTALERREAAKSHFTAGVTPRYASPQLMARHKPEIGDDVYGLACLAYETFIGIHPFDDGNGTQTLRFPPPMRPGLTVSQYNAVVNGLQFERRKRTSTVREFMDEFAAASPRTAWKKPAAWAAAAILALLIGWFIGRPSPNTEVPPVVLQPETHVVPTPVPSMKPTTVAAQPGSVIRDCPTCPSMTVLPTGHYTQGSPSNDPEALASEKPQHAVTIAAPLALSTNAVTVADFRDFVTATGHKLQGCEVYDGAWHRKTKADWKDPGFTQTDTHPVTCVSWNDATAYSRWLSAKTRHVYRLPSAAEWEYAARAGGDLSRPWGANTAGACSYANVADRTAEGQYPGWNVFGCSDNYVNTAPVGSFKANAFGLNDMLGNVFTWTQDCWHSDYTGAPGDGSARVDGNCSEHELRGGSWFSTPAFVRAPYRNHFASDYRTSSVGIRLVREISP